MPKMIVFKIHLKTIKGIGLRTNEKATDALAEIYKRFYTEIGCSYEEDE